MPARDQYRSRIVAWLKILLPLAALGLLSTLFLFSRTIDPSRAIPYSRVDVKKLAKQPQITAPDYAGVTDSGTAVSVVATKAKPTTADAKSLSATALVAKFEAADGRVTNVDAANGTIDQVAGKMDLGGGVVIHTPGGYRIDTEALTGLLNRTHMESAGKVTAIGPLGHLEAGKMVLDQSPADVQTDGQAAGQAADSAKKPPHAPYVLVFNGGVKLVYQPPKKGN